MKVVKDLFKLLLLVIITTIVFIVISMFLPFSEGFQAGSEKADPSGLLFILLVHTWVCITLFYIVRHSRWRGAKLIVWLMLAYFFVYSFMAQIETFFFRSAFPLLTHSDIFFIAVANGMVVLARVPLGVMLFGQKQNEAVYGAFGYERRPLPSLLYQLALIGISYVCIYFLFGYFVAWQVEDLRMFYSGDPTDHGFLASMANNFHDNPVLFPFQFVRGVLFGVFVLPVVQMFKGRPRQLLISLILVFVSPGLGLAIPNFLFPDTVRWAHFVEMITSMSLFAVVIWWVYVKVPRTLEKS